MKDLNVDDLRLSFLGSASVCSPIKLSPEILKLECQIKHVVNLDAPCFVQDTIEDPATPTILLTIQ